MAIAFVSQSSNGGAGVTSVIVTAPASIVDNNYLILVVNRRNGGGTITPPAGFTLVASASRSLILTEMYYKKCASESGDYTVSVSAAANMNAGIVQYSGIDGTSPLDGTATTNNGNSTALVGTGLTAASAGSLLVFGLGFASGVSLNAAAGMTRRINQADGGSFDSAVGSNEELLVSSGATGDRTVTMGFNDDFVGIMAVFKASSAATLEQEGFRFRNDDGSETTATWRQTQDTDDSADENEAVRLRIIINGTGDPSAGQYKLQYREVGNDTWLDVQ